MGCGPLQAQLGADAKRVHRHRRPPGGRDPLRPVGPRQKHELAGTITLGGELRVNRMGFGAMRLTGPGIWGAPREESEALGAAPGD